MRLLRNRAPQLALAAGFVALVGVGFLLALRLTRTGRRAQESAATATTAALPTVATTEAETTTTPTTTEPSPAQSTVPMSWDNAGGLVWHWAAVDPTLLGEQMRAAGFGWVAIYLGAEDSVSPPDPSWITRFRAASGLPVGGWSVLGTEPATDAAQAAQVIGQDGLAFYIADAEAPYGYTSGSQHSSIRFLRSRQFVSAFRAALPKLPAGISSYCRPDQHDLDWAAWAHGGFVFLPQAYVNDFGTAASPSACTKAAARYFPASQVHPTVASYSGVLGVVSPQRFARLLANAGTTGFSIYPAEAGMDQQNWQAYGQAIASLHIASPAQP